VHARASERARDREGGMEKEGERAREGENQRAGEAESARARGRSSKRESQGGCVFVFMYVVL